MGIVAVRLAKTEIISHLGMLIPTLKCVAWNSRLVVVGFAAGTIEKVRERREHEERGKPKLTASLCDVQIPANLLLLKQASVVGLYWGGNMSKSHHLRTTNQC